MRYALVDDATLEAAKRMEGKTVTKNALEVAGDILALENLLQAILFCDQILYIDQTGNKRNQNSRFFESFQSVNLDADTYSRLLRITNQMTDDYIPCIEGGKFTDECFCAFFKALGMNISFIWEKKSDVFCLTPRIVRKTEDPDGPLYKKLLNMMLVELSDKSFLDEINQRIPLLYDSDGQIINNCYMVKDKGGKEYPTRLSHQSDALFKALNYMAFRSILYILVAKELKADLILSPMRGLFQWGGYNRFCVDNQSLIPQLTSVVHRNHLNNIIIPMFSLWIAEHMIDGSGFIQAAFELRKEKEFAAARRHLDEIDEMLETNGTDNGESMDLVMTKLDGQIGKIIKKYGMSIGNDSSAASCAVISSTSSSHAKLPDLEKFSFSLKPEKPSFDFNQRDRFGVVFRSVREDLVRMGDLGEYYDVVTSKINYKTEAVLQNIKVEMDEIHHEHCWWRAPM